MTEPPVYVNKKKLFYQLQQSSSNEVIFGLDPLLKQPSKAQTEQVLKNRKTFNTHLLISGIIVLVALAWSLISPAGKSVFSTILFKSQTQKQGFSIFSFSLFSTLVSWGCYFFAFKMLYTRSKFTQTEDEFIVESLQNVTGTMFEYVFDVIYLNWGVQVLVTLFSRWFAYIIVIVVIAYAGWKAYELVNKLLGMKDQLLASMGISPDMLAQLKQMGEPRDFGGELKEIDEALKKKGVSNHAKDELISRKRKIEKQMKESKEEKKPKEKRVVMKR